MTLLEKTKSVFTWLISFPTQFFLGPPPHYEDILCPELTRYFLTTAINERARVLANAGGATSPEEHRQLQITHQGQTLKEYSERLELALKQEIETRDYTVGRLAGLKDQLPAVKLPGNLSDELWQKRDALIDFFRYRGVLPEGRLTYFETVTVLGDCLRAVQKVVLDVVRVEYTAKDRETDVPKEIPQVLIEILKRIDEASRVVQSPVEIKPLNKAETELRILVARARRTACLPLKPIPTSPLSSSDPNQHYVGRPDEDALRLARQIRHADGTILITGYRGVGKSSFVNRVMYHVMAQQNDVPQDGLLVVPVVVNLAKVSGVQNILRLTLRSVREALLDPNSRDPQKVSCHKSGKLKELSLPLREDKEVDPLDEAYIRATYKVTMSRGNSVDKKWEAGTSFSIDPGKLIGGSIVGIELGKFLEGGIKRTRTERINRELNLLDYDENAAEDDLARLIRNLAEEREFGKSRAKVKIKLVFIFDELDKMDVELGLKPMIEGLKNLFLQQHSVFVLVTSKSFYYTLLKERAIEDAMLNSYFSAIVPVPLLSYTEARKLINDWIDIEGSDLLKTLTPSEIKLLDQLTRFLVYKSFGNPRDIIRELRLMQEWADTSNQPYLTDALAKSAEFQIIVALQECIEKTAVPQQTTGPSAENSKGVVTLASERMGKDESRLEQIRRGLYILTEELINRQQLLLEPRQQASESEHDPTPATPPDLAQQLGEVLVKLAKPSSNGRTESLPLAKIYKDNFSLLSLEDVQELAKRLGSYLCLVHDAPDLFASAEWGSRRPLFTMIGRDEIRVLNDFYSLTGRQAVSALADGSNSKEQGKTTEQLIIAGEQYAGQPGWSSKSTAISIIKQLGTNKIGQKLEDFLWDTVQKDPEPTHRLAAAERLTTAQLFGRAGLDLTELIKNETDERVITIFASLMGGAASDDAARKRASDALVALLLREKGSQFFRVLNDATSISALTVLQTVGDKDVMKPLLEWFCIVGLGSQVLRSTALSVFTALARRLNINLADEIITDPTVLNFFASGQRLLGGTFMKAIDPPNEARAELQNYLRELLLVDPLGYADKLLKADAQVEVDEILASLWDVAAELDPRPLTDYIFEALVKWPDNPDLLTAAYPRLTRSLRKSQNFKNRFLFYLRTKADPYSFTHELSEKDTERLKISLEELEKAEPEPTPNLVTPKMDLNYLKEILNKSNPAAPNTAFPFTPRTSTVETPEPRFGFLALAFVAFLLPFIFFTRDLPVGASFGVQLVSRLIILLMDIIIVLPLANSVLTIQENLDLVTKSNISMNVGWSRSSSAGGWRDLLPKDKNLFFVVIVPVVYGLMALHGRYIGPLTFRNQALQFFFNLPAILLAIAAFYYRKK